MPLTEFWTSNPQAVDQLTIEQAVHTAGNGDLKDNSVCSQELRTYLSQISSDKIASYVDHCLSAGFSKSGMVLQDLVNELGRRLDYSVTNGRYQGIQKAIGFDGIWQSPEGHAIIVEVKTTDAYRVSLNSIASYRNKLTAAGHISPPSSILIVVGRQDTGELEAQVRGSPHAWDVRLISAEALIKLVRVKESTDATETGLKIRSLLAPMEYTRLDRMIDAMFTAATDVETAVASEKTADVQEAAEDQSQTKVKGVWHFTDAGLLQGKREAIIAAVSKQFGVPLIKKSRALYWDASHTKRVACTISKLYTKPGSYRYWYAYHPQWDQFLNEGTEGRLAIGCMDLDVAFALPWSVINGLLEFLNTTTEKGGETYWHLHLKEVGPGAYSLNLPGKPGELPLRALSG